MKSKKLFILLILAFTSTLFGQNSPREIFEGEKESLPSIPAKEERIRVIITSDARNEIDDVWAIALAILSPERFDIEGFVGGHYDHSQWRTGTGRESIAKSVQEIHTILEKAGMKDRYPVYRGAHPMQYPRHPSSSEGVDFIVERAMASVPDDPLWLIGLGAATDIVSAYLQEPAIKDRIIVFWHARTEETWPFRAHNFNIKGDMHAARMMFHAPFPLILFDTGTHLAAGTLEESERYIKLHGELGEYLYKYRLKSDYYKSPTKGYFDLGDIAVLLDPDLGTWEVVECPTVTQYMDYNFYEAKGKILRCYDIDRDKTFSLFYEKLRQHAVAIE